MNRYLAFAGGYQPKQHLEDFQGDFEKLHDAKGEVHKRDPEGFPVHDWGSVLDTKTGQVHHWTTDGRAFGKDEWRFPIQLEQA